MLTSLGQSTIRLRCYGWNTSAEGSLRRKKNKVEEIQLANLGSLGSLANNKVEEIQLANLASLGILASNQSIAWYACEALLGKEKYERLNGWKTRTSVH